MKKTVITEFVITVFILFRFKLCFIGECEVTTNFVMPIVAAGEVETSKKWDSSATLHFDQDDNVRISNYDLSVRRRKTASTVQGKE